MLTRHFDRITATTMHARPMTPRVRQHRHLCAQGPKMVSMLRIKPSQLNSTA